MSNTLVRINKRAQAIRKSHPGKSWKSAQREAAREIKASKAGKRKKPKKVSGMARRKKAKVGTKPKYKVVHEVRRISGISYQGGKMRIAGTAEVEREKEKLRAMIGERLGWIDVAISSAKTKREKTALQKKRMELKRELNSIK